MSEQSRRYLPRTFGVSLVTLLVALLLVGVAVHDGDQLLGIAMTALVLGTGWNAYVTGPWQSSGRAE